jgi:hypothetical protein
MPSSIWRLAAFHCRLPYERFFHKTGVAMRHCGTVAPRHGSIEGSHLFHCRLPYHVETAGLRALLVNKRPGDFGPDFVAQERPVDRTLLRPPRPIEIASRGRYSGWAREVSIARLLACICASVALLLAPSAWSLSSRVPIPALSALDRSCSTRSILAREVGILLCLASGRGGRY